MKTRHWTLSTLAALAVLGCSDTASAQPQLTVSPATVTNQNTPLAFNNIPSGGVSPTQPVTISTSGNTGATVILQVNDALNTPWLQISPGPSVNIPATVSVRCNTQNLAAGSYTGSFTITVDGAPTDQVTVYVSLTVTGISNLSATPFSLSFNAQAGATSATPASAQVTIASNGVQLNYTLQATTNDGHNWLLLSATQGSTSGSPFTVSVNPSAVSAVTYPAIFNGNILASSTTSADSVVISVQMTVNASASISVLPTNPPPFLYQAGAAADPAAQQLSITSTGGSTTFSVQASPQVSWLVLSALGGNASSTPTTITLNATPHEQQLQPGTYTTSVIVTPAGQSALPAIPITLVVAAHPLLQLSTNTLAFTAPFGGNPSPAQSLIVSSSGAASIPFMVSSNQSWLTASASASSTPTTVTVQVNPASLNIQNYTGLITLTPTNGDTYTETISVSLSVTSPNQLVAGPGDLLFSYEIGKAPPVTQTVQVGSTGQPLQFGVTVATSNCGPNWLTAQPVQASTTTSISISVNTTGMTTAQTCSGTVTLSFQSGQGPSALPINVTLAVSSSAELVVNQQMDFGVTTAALGGPPFQQQISLTSTDPTAPVDYSAAVLNVAGGAWLGISGATSGLTPQNLLIQYTPSVLTVPGTYGGTVVLSSSTLNGTQLSIPVSLTVTTTTVVTTTPTSLTFTEAQGGAAPAAQTVTLASSPGQATFTEVINYLNGSGWLQVSPTSGNASGPVQVTILPNTLSQGQYNAQINFAFQGSATTATTVNVVLNVLPAQTVSASPSTLNFAYQIGGSTPASQALSVTGTGGSANVTVSVSSSGWLSADTKGGATPQTVNLSVNPQGLVPNTYVGSVSISSPGVLANPISIPVTFVVSAPAGPQPSIIINNATGNSGVIAPGEEIAIKGNFLGPATPANGTFFTLNSSGGVSSTLAGVQVLFDNVPGTPLYVSANQIDVVVPYEINGRLSTSMVVQFDGVPSASFPLAVASTSPGLFSNNFTGLGQVAAVNQNGTFNGTASGFAAAPRGTVISLYGTGGGQTNPVSTTGSVTPIPTSAAQLLNISNVTATVGGLPATVTFAGAAPGLVTGVIQVNVQIPQGVAPGNSVPVTISIGSTSSPIGTTIAVQ